MSYSDRQQDETSGYTGSEDSSYRAIEIDDRTVDAIKKRLGFEPMLLIAFGINGEYKLLQAPAYKLQPINDRNVALAELNRARQNNVALTGVTCTPPPVPPETHFYWWVVDAGGNPQWCWKWPPV